MPSAERTSAECALIALLRMLGVLDLCALAAVVMPDAIMASIYRWSGLGEFPQLPIVSYLARSDSALYALHGAMLLFLSSDVRRYRPVIRFMAVAVMVHGAILGGIDTVSGMPVYWTLAESCGFAMTGMAILLLLHASPPEGQAWNVETQIQK